jgi:hypothetical protein
MIEALVGQAEKGGRAMMSLLPHDFTRLELVSSSVVVPEENVGILRRRCICGLYGCSRRRYGKGT